MRARGLEILNVLVLGYEEVLVLEYEGISAGVGGYWYRGTMVLVPGYEGINTGVEGVLVPG